MQLVGLAHLPMHLNRATLQLVRIAQVDLLAQLLRPYSWEIRRLVLLICLLVRCHDIVLRTVLLVPIFIPLNLAGLVVLAVIGNVVCLRLRAGALSLVLDCRLVCVSMLLLQLWMSRLQGYNRVSLSQSRTCSPDVTSRSSVYPSLSFSDRSRLSFHHFRSSRSASHISSGSHSLSCMSSRGRSLPPGPFWPQSHSRSHSCCIGPPEDHQGEHASTDIVDVVSLIQESGSLPLAPSESHKVWGFKAAVDAKDQPSSFYQLLIGDSSPDILLDLNDRISSATSRMRSKMMFKLLPYPGVSTASKRRKGQSCALLYPTTELGSMKSFKNLNNTDVVLSSTEAKDLEVAAHTLQCHRGNFLDGLVDVCCQVHGAFFIL